MAFTVEQVAIVAHEANKAYCETIGDSSQKHWDEAKQWQRDSAIRGVTFRLHANGPVSPESQHNGWLADKIADGWKYGPVKDDAKKEHPCCVPYDQLPAEQRMKDHLFAAIVDAFYKCGLIWEVEAGMQKAR